MKKITGRKPDPYITQGPDGRFIVGCNSCPSYTAGFRWRRSAQAWAERHVCAPVETTADKVWPR